MKLLGKASTIRHACVESWVTRHVPHFRTVQIDNSAKYSVTVDDMIIPVTPVT